MLDQPAKPHKFPGSARASRAHFGALAEMLSNKQLEKSPRWRGRHRSEPDWHLHARARALPGTEFTARNPSMRSVLVGV